MARETHVRGPHGSRSAGLPPRRRRGLQRHTDSPAGVWPLPLFLPLPFPGGDAPGVGASASGVQRPCDSSPRGSFCRRRVPRETSAALSSGLAVQAGSTPPSWAAVSSDAAAGARFLFAVGSVLCLHSPGMDFIFCLVSRKKHYKLL